MDGCTSGHTYWHQYSPTGLSFTGSAYKHGPLDCS